MNARAVNVTILLLLILELASGLGGFLVGEPGDRWVFWLHRAGGLALVLLLLWKAGIAWRSYKRRGVTAGTALSVVFGGLFLAALITGLLWVVVGLPRVPVPVFGGWTILSLHVAVSVALIPPLLIHAYGRWPRPRRADLLGRRAALRMLGLLAAGLILWPVQEALAALAAPPGAPRRFTGSREEASHAGNRHPITNWLGGRTPKIDPDRWRLRIHGEVVREASLSYEEVFAVDEAVREATLDCTGGWYTVQHWGGVPVADLLEKVGAKSGARSVLFRSTTGYDRRFPLEEARNLLLATRVEGEPLSAGHGFPARLVAPDHRGYDWVKWVAEVEVSRDPAWLEPPLPLQ